MTNLEKYNYRKEIVSETYPVTGTEKYVSETAEVDVTDKLAPFFGKTNGKNILKKAYILVNLWTAVKYYKDESRFINSLIHLDVDDALKNAAVYDIVIELLNGNSFCINGIFPLSEELVMRNGL